MRAAGYRGPQRLQVQLGQVVGRSLEEVVSAVFSLSGSAPHLFGDRLADFEQDLRALLLRAAPGGVFAERRGEIAAVIWRP